MTKQLKSCTFKSLGWTESKWGIHSGCEKETLNTSVNIGIFNPETGAERNGWEERRTPWCYSNCQKDIFHWVICFIYYPGFKLAQYEICILKKKLNNLLNVHKRWRRKQTKVRNIINLKAAQKNKTKSKWDTERSDVATLKRGAFIINTSDP